jgi:flagellar protein FlgJ
MKVAPGLPAAAGAADSGAARTAAKQLEAYFLRQVLSQVHGSAMTSGGGGLDGGFAGDTFHEMLDGALADKIASAGGLGLAPALEKAMGGPSKAGGPSGHSKQPQAIEDVISGLKFPGKRPNPEMGGKQCESRAPRSEK